MLDSTARNWLSGRLHRAKSEVFGEAVTLTPELAASILERNPDNRNILAGRVKNYADDIRAGRWALNGEPIVISQHGLLNDGQHRCAAVVESGEPIETVIVFGIDRETRKTTNQGRGKSAGDYLSMDGVTNAATVAGIARMAVCYDRHSNVSMLSTVTNGAVMERVDADFAALSQSAHFASGLSWRIKPISAPAPFGFCHYLTSKIAPEAANEYFRSLATGENLSSNDPALTVRNRLIAAGRVARQEKVEMMLHGWNAFRRGQTRNFVRVSGQLPALV